MKNLVLDDIPFPAAVKSQDSIYQLVNNEFKSFCGLRNTENLSGKSVKDLPSHLNHLSTTIRDEDLFVINKKHKESFLLKLDNAWNGCLIFLVTKSIFKTPDDAQNILVLCNPIPSAMFRRLSKLDIVSGKANSYRLVEQYTNLKLSKAEMQALYYFMLGKTAKESAIIVDRSQRTIETHLEHIRMKTKCQNRSELMEYCKKQGFLSVLPSFLLD